MQRPGEQAKFTGVYRAVHLGHRPDHDIIVLAGELFPPCRTCGAKVGFELVTRIEHATHDWDFAGPLSFPAAQGGK